VFDGALVVADWLEKAYRTRESDVGTVFVICIGFLLMFSVSRIIYFLVEKLVVRRTLPWSAWLFSLVFAAAFWATPSPAISEILAILTGRRSTYQSPLSRIPDLLVVWAWAQFVANPFALVGLFVFVIYLARPRFPRAALIAAVLVSMVACTVFELYYNHNPDVARS
jgi:hypothetical protein